MELAFVQAVAERLKAVAIRHSNDSSAAANQHLQEIYIDTCVPDVAATSSSCDMKTCIAVSEPAEKGLPAASDCYSIWQSESCAKFLLYCFQPLASASHCHSRCASSCPLQAIQAVHYHVKK